LRMDSEIRKAQILGAALKIIHEEGIHLLTLRKIADAVGVSEAALFRHYRNKEDIVGSLANMIFDKNQLFLKGENQWKALENMLTKQLETFQNNPMYASVLCQEDIFREYPSVKERFDLHRSYHALLIRQLVEEGQREGSFDEEVDGGAFALLLMGSIRLTVLEWRHANFSFDLRERAAPILHLLSKCLGVR
jgi:AcrR family transcriptional regulator